MSPSHHLPEDVLFEYGAGGADEARALVAATHVTLCEACRDELGGVEAVGGALLEKLAGEALAADALERAMARLDEAPPPAPPAARVPGVDWLPAPLLRYVAEAGGLVWQRVLPGVRQLVLAPIMSARAVRLIEFRPGLNLGRHTHGGLELNVVLTGGFRDGGAHYMRGDVAVVDDSVTHSPLVDDAEPCILLVAGETPSLPVTWLGRLIARFVKM
jgi:putative transcriptional regulator